MSEWPKEVENPDALGEVFEVVPADLARELYEALGAARAAGEKCYPIVQGKKTTRALVRYEQEVGGND